MDLITGPPPAEAIAAMNAVDGVQVAPTVLATQAGPCGHLGPESAGAILILQGTFADETSFRVFWSRVIELTSVLATAPGFIRRYNFVDGPHYTLMAWWRSVADAHAFFAQPEHQAAMRSTFEQRINYTHFAGLWEMSTARARHIFCQACDGVAPSTEPTCPGCGTSLEDPFAS